MKRRFLVLVACGLLLDTGGLAVAQEAPLSQLVVNLFRPERFVTPWALGPITRRIFS